MLGEGSATDFKYDKIDVSHPTSDAEEEQQYEMMQKDKDARRKAYEHERRYERILVPRMLSISVINQKDT